MILVFCFIISIHTVRARERAPVCVYVCACNTISDMFLINLAFEINEPHQREIRLKFME